MNGIAIRGKDKTLVYKRWNKNRIMKIMKNRRMREDEGRVDDHEDRISNLPDDLIHHIMSFLDTRFAVQSSVLSSRWKLVWTTLPFLSFNEYHQLGFGKNFDYFNFLDHVFSCRNHQSQIFKLKLCPFMNLLLIKKYVKYAISHDVEHLHVESIHNCSLSVFSSKSLKELKLVMKFESDKVMESDCWSLPNLTTLSLASKNHNILPEFPKSCLTCLPALTTLCLERCMLPESLSLPALTTLRLESCTLPGIFWDFPSLLTLQLGNVVFPENTSQYFLSLASLVTLAIDSSINYVGRCIISCPQLVNLKIRAYIETTTLATFVVLAPRLRNFKAIGIFRMKFEGSDLENVDIRFWDDTTLKAGLKLLNYKQGLFIGMFSQLGSAKILTLDSMTIQALSKLSYVLVRLRCPFYNLKYLKLPHGLEESSISSSLREYLLSGSPRATIVKTLSQGNVIPKMAPEHMAENSVVDADKVKQFETLVAGPSNDLASSSLDNRDCVLWQGHEVNSEFVGLLDLIMQEHPETFAQLTFKNKKIWTMKLNMLCSSVNAFTKTSMTEVDTELLTEYREIFTDLRRWGFNINWLMCHLNNIEQLHFSKSSPNKFHAINSRTIMQKLKYKIYRHFGLRR